MCYLKPLFSFLEPCVRYYNVGLMILPIMLGSGPAIAQIASPSKRASEIAATVARAKTVGAINPKDARRAQFRLQEIVQEEKFLRLRFGGQLSASDAQRLNGRLDQISASGAASTPH
jgi:hypothetical protein